MKISERIAAIRAAARSFGPENPDAALETEHRAAQLQRLLDLFQAARDERAAMAQPGGKWTQDGSFWVAVDRRNAALDALSAHGDI